MAGRLYTIHHRAATGETEAVGETGWLAALPPLWALWEGLWLSLGAMLGAGAALAWWAPLALPAYVSALALLTVFEGAGLRRLELRLTGWREVALAEADTPEGAVEVYLTGVAVAAGHRV